MGKQIFVSILVPIYNVDKVIGKCLSTLFCQTYDNLEYVFVNDCTPDRSMEVLKEKLTQYAVPKDKVKIISHKNNLGIAATRNDCLNYAKGDYVLFVDSDDWLELTMVEELVNSTQNGKIDIVACDYFLEKKNGQRIICQENYGSGCCENMRKAVNYEIFTILWKLLIRRSLFSNISFTPDINIGEDYIVSIKLYYYAQTFYHLHEPLYHYSQINDVRYSNLKIQNIEDHIKAVQEIEFFLKNVHIYDDDIIRRLNLRKFNIKKYFLDINFLNYERWKTTFPESDRMWREIPYSRKEKVKFWLAENHLFFLLKLITC